MNPMPRRLPPIYDPYEVPRRNRLDLSRKPGETDALYRERLLGVIGAQCDDARLSAYAMGGKCLDDFGNSVSHAEFIGWRGAAGRPSDRHLQGCACASAWKERLLYAQRVLDYRQEEALKAAQAAEQAAATLEALKSECAVAVAAQKNLYGALYGDEEAARLEKVFERILSG